MKVKVHQIGIGFDYNPNSLQAGAKRVGLTYNDVDLVDLSILSAIEGLLKLKSTKIKDIDGFRHFEVDWVKICDRLPYSGISSRSGIKRRLSKLVKCGLIFPHRDNETSGKNPLFRFTEKHSAFHNDLDEYESDPSQEGCPPNDTPHLSTKRHTPCPPNDTPHTLVIEKGKDKGIDGSATPPISNLENLPEEKRDAIRKAMSNNMTQSELGKRVKAVVDRNVSSSEKWKAFFSRGKGRVISEITSSLFDKQHSGEFFYSNDNSLKKYIEVVYLKEKVGEVEEAVDPKMQEMIAWCIGKMEDDRFSYPEPKPHELKKLRMWLDGIKGEFTDDERKFGSVSYLWKNLLEFFHDRHENTQFYNLGFCIGNFWDENKSWIMENVKLELFGMMREYLEAKQREANSNNKS